jgi:hypothetical protein
MSGSNNPPRERPNTADDAYQRGYDDCLREHGAIFKPKNSPQGGVSRLHQTDKDSISDWLDPILTDLTNFMVWDGQQEWKPDYDRDANRKNSQNRAKAAIYSHIEAVIDEVEHSNDVNGHTGRVRANMATELRLKLLGDTTYFPTAQEGTQHFGDALKNYKPQGE